MNRQIALFALLVFCFSVLSVPAPLDAQEKDKKIKNILLLLSRRMQMLGGPSGSAVPGVWSVAGW